MCTSSSDGTSSYCNSQYVYESWLVIEGCQSAMSSDMALLDAAANANHIIYDGVAQMEVWATGQLYFPSTAAVCDVWRDTKVCGGDAHRYDQTVCESLSSAYGCTWGENEMMCLNAEGYPHGQSNYLDFLWMSYNDMTNCDQHHDLDSCNTDSDCVYLDFPTYGYTFCSTKLHRELQILEEAGAPAHIMGLAVDRGLHNHCSQFSDEVSCGDEAPMCFWISSMTMCQSFGDYARWNMSVACGEPYVSDDNIAIAYGYADMAALESAAISGDSGSHGSNSFPDDATFCPSWAKYQICSWIYEEASCNEGGGVRVRERQ